MQDDNVVPEQPTNQMAEASTVPKKKFTKLPIAIALVMLVLLCVGVGSVFAYKVLQSSPEQRLEQAIINASAVTAITQTTQIDATIEGGSDLKGSVVAQRDVSDPSNPRTKATVDLDVVLLGITIELKSEYLCISQTECYVKYNQFKVPEELSTKDSSAFLNKWLQFNPTNVAQKADPFAIVGSINTVLGEIITGNITGTAKDTIATAASDGKTYTFTSSSKEKLGSSNTIKYDVQLDGESVLNINKVVADQYKIKNVFTNASDVTKNATIWVDTASNIIVLVEITSNDITSVITYDKYSEVPTITAPESYIKPEQYNAIF